MWDVKHSKHIYPIMAHSFHFGTIILLDKALYPLPVLPHRTQAYEIDVTAAVSRYSQDINYFPTVTLC
jgi:hypothetical protein